MTRKVYYYILAITLSLIVIYAVAGIFFRKNFGISYSAIAHLKDLIALFIVLYHTAQSKKIIRILNTLLLPACMFGLVFLIMHWPFGKILFFIPATIILIGLFADLFIRVPERLTTFFILLFPAFQLLYIYAVIHRSGGPFAVLAIFLMGIIALALIIRILRQNERPIA
jgi:hypothetical protein